MNISWKAIVAATCCFLAVSNAQTATPVKCTAINQVFVDDPRAPKYFFLDVPRGATFVSGQYQARAAAGGPWQSCAPADRNWFNQVDTALGTAELGQKDRSLSASGVTACQVIAFTHISEPSPQPDPSDGTEHYFVLVHAISPPGFFGEVYARMVLQYTMPGPSCIVQHTYYVDKGTSVQQLADLRVPSGKTITHEHTFGRIDPPGPHPPAGQQPSNWIDCGSDQGQWPNGVSMYNQCLSPIAVGMQTQRLLPDGVDSAPGRTSACGANGWGGVGWCRISLEYAP